MFVVKIYTSLVNSTLHLAIQFQNNLVYFNQSSLFQSNIVLSNLVPFIIVYSVLVKNLVTVVILQCKHPFTYLDHGNRTNSHAQTQGFCPAVPAALQTCGAWRSSYSPSPPHQCVHHQQALVPPSARAEGGSFADSNQPDVWVAPGREHKLAPDWKIFLFVNVTNWIIYIYKSIYSIHTHTHTLYIKNN